MIVLVYQAVQTLSPNFIPLTTLKKTEKLVFKTNYRLMQVKSVAECSDGEHSAILLAFIRLPFVIKIFVLSIFGWLYCISF